MSEKMKTDVNVLAARLVQFAEDFDTYNFMDAMDGTREEMVEQMAHDLADPDFANGVKGTFDEWAEDDIADDIVDDFNAMRAEITAYADELEALQQASVPVTSARERAAQAEARLGGIVGGVEAQSEMEVE